MGDGEDAFAPREGDTPIPALSEGNGSIRSTFAASNMMPLAAVAIGSQGSAELMGSSHLRERTSMELYHGRVNPRTDTATSSRDAGFIEASGAHAHISPASSGTGRGVAQAQHRQASATPTSGPKQQQVAAWICAAAPAAFGKVSN